MGWDFTRTPDWRIAIWSSVVDDFVFEGTDEEALDFCLKDFVEDYKKEIKKKIANATYNKYLGHKRALMYRSEGHEDGCALNLIVSTDETVCNCTARPGKKLGEL